MRPDVDQAPPRKTQRTEMSPPPKFDDPSEAIAALADRLATVHVESQMSVMPGRVLAQAIGADRDSPAADVSAMDGYAIRLSDLQRTDTIPVIGESAPGAAPPAMDAVAAMRIFTGAVVPEGCEAIVKREDTEEGDGKIRLLDAAKSASSGEHIRRAGENTKVGTTVLPSGTLLSAAPIATLANFGYSAIDCFARVRVAVITTGDEVKPVDAATLDPWQLRNSNGAAISAVLRQQSWIDEVSNDHCRDDRDALAAIVQEKIAVADAVVLTGGVSMGDYDYVPDVVREAGGEVVFHGLPVRPGKPILGAATDSGKLIVGLPGNPVSATIGCHRFVRRLLAKQSGQTNWDPYRPTVRLELAGTKTIPLYWLRLVSMKENGNAQPVLSQGSGDLVSLGESTGYVEVPPGESGDGPWSYFGW